MSQKPTKCDVGFIWDANLERFDFGRKHPIRVGRFQMVRDFLEETRFLEQPNVRVIEPQQIPTDLLRRVHSQAYLDQVRQISETGVGEIDIDTPGFKGIYENASVAAGGTVAGVKAILEGRVEHFLSPTGGFHHAMYERGGGFCVFNDIAAAIYGLKDHGVSKILVADFDVHHGNGTQRYFFEDPEVMVISFHEDPEWMYPHDGFIGDIGEGSGRGYNINMHFPMDAGDAVYRYAFDEIVPPLIDRFKPEFILFLPGFDAHYMDRLAHMTLTTDMIRYVASRIHNRAHKWASGRLGVLSGGGYHPEAFRWGVGVVMSVLSG
ncbi:MAG: histone deacetylase family protein, partial [Candidatus Thorarchaeota archaeon]